MLFDDDVVEFRLERVRLGYTYYIPVLRVIIVFPLVGYRVCAL